MNERTEEAGDALDLVDDLLAEEEAERIATLSPGALRAEMAEHGIDPARARALVERVVAEAGADVVEPARGGIASASVAQASWGRREGRSRPTWIAIAVAAGLAIAAGITERRAVVAWWTPARRSPGPVPTVEPLESQQPAEVAATLRRHAFIDCAQTNLERCEAELDMAEELDPAGESAPAVQEARAAIRNGRRPEPMHEDKPKR